jgi:hypothetical protein
VHIRRPLNRLIVTARKAWADIISNLSLSHDPLYQLELLHHHRHSATQNTRREQGTGEVSRNVLTCHFESHYLLRCLPHNLERSTHEPLVPLCFSGVDRPFVSTMQDKAWEQDFATSRPVQVHHTPHGRKSLPSTYADHFGLSHRPFRLPHESFIAVPSHFSTAAELIHSNTPFCLSPTPSLCRDHVFSNSTSTSRWWRS